jgi:hypothetical protein
VNGSTNAEQSCEAIGTQKTLKEIVMGFWSDAANTIMAISDHLGLIKLVRMNRDDACAMLNDFVKSSSPAELDRFEAALLTQANAMFGHDRRMRAMQLYAHLKIAEYAHYGTYRGFTTSPAPVQ